MEVDATGGAGVGEPLDLPVDGSGGLGGVGGDGHRPSSGGVALVGSGDLGGDQGRVRGVQSVVGGVGIDGFGAPGS